MTKQTDLAERARAIGAPLAQPKPMRRGSVTERYVKCSKPGCPCAERPEGRHGPYFSWTRKIDGRTQSRFLTREQAALVQGQIAAGQALLSSTLALLPRCFGTCVVRESQRVVLTRAMLLQYKTAVDF